MYALTGWLICLKAYRLKHPELTLQQAQKLAAVDYKRVMDPVLGATTVSSVTGYGQKPIKGKGDGIQPDISPGVYFHPYIHSTTSSECPCKQTRLDPQ